jgi:hypothetical protein
MSLRRTIALVCVTLLGGASSLLVGCGSGSEKLIPQGNANALNSNLDAIANAVTAGRCTATLRKLTDLRSDLNHLPATVDPALRHRLDEGYSRLQQQALEDCRANTTPKTTTETTPTTTTETTPTVTTETTTVTVPPTTTTPTTTTPPTSTTPPTTTTGTGGTIVPTGTVPSPTPEPRK